ncbi:MAG TPA: anhydro-N-acetylmuramic acid kinase [Armatimonadota bacterium]|nr:anhydro-N-acetylmuramic acid kinase [Armatimonadota bacterium]
MSVLDTINRYAGKTARTVIGLMSGTSADGIDAALARISGSGDTIQAQLIAFRKTPYEPGVRKRILALFSADAPAVEICRMNFAIGRLFGEAALDLIHRCSLHPQNIDLIASHGQTVCHLPPGGPLADLSGGSTLQIGEPAVIADMAGVTVVADFRPQDLAAGGQGAPLVPYADYALFRHPEKTRAIQNIGGIANVTVLPAGGGIDDVIAFDTGPGNMIIDALVTALTKGEKTFDEDGALSALGRVDEKLLSWLMSHDYISRRPPKSTGREEFGAQFVGDLLARAEAHDISAEDLLATAAAFTAASIAKSYRDFILFEHDIDEVILGGGGSYNATLRRMLQERLPGTPIFLHEDLGLSGDAKEALAFAILGNETMLGQPSNVPRATGARRAVILGKIVPAQPHTPEK